MAASRNYHHQNPYDTHPYNNQTVNQQPIRSHLTFDNKWSTDLCECCTDCKSCCLAFWCWPCFLCCLDSAARECPMSTCCISTMNGSGIGISILRAKIRASYRIEGSVIGDCFLGVCCPCCTALQLYRELKYRGEVRD